MIILVPTPLGVDPSACIMVATAKVSPFSKSSVIFLYISSNIEAPSRNVVDYSPRHLTIKYLNNKLKFLMKMFVNCKVGNIDNI